MYARNFRVILKVDASMHFLRLMANTIIPLLHKQNGFVDEVTLVAEDHGAAMAISFRDTAENRLAFDQAVASEVWDLLSDVVVGPPTVEVYEVVNANFYRMPAGGVPCRDSLP